MLGSSAQALTTLKDVSSSMCCQQQFESALIGRTCHPLSSLAEEAPADAFYLAGMFVSGNKYHTAAVSPDVQKHTNANHRSFEGMNARFQFSQQAV
jgi:hypothetical protein